VGSIGAERAFADRVFLGAMADYEDLPCDFADASLVYAALKTGVREIWTLETARIQASSSSRGSPGSRPRWRRRLETIVTREIEPHRG